MNARGMTLLEVMVALAVFAIAGLAVMKTASEHLSALNYLEQKTLATWVVENQLVQQKLENKWPGDSWVEGDEQMAGSTWYWRYRGVATADNNFLGARYGSAYRGQGREPGRHDADLYQPMTQLSVHTSRPVRHAGFTLLEMLVAIAIFASLSMGAYQVLQGVLTSDEVAKRKEARLNELQLAFTLLERDVTQMVPRSGRIEGENNKVLLAASRFGQQSDDWGMAFMRSGWLNPDGMLPRSHLQRVGWRLKDQKLERLSYLYPDPVIGTEPRIQPVLTGITAFRLYFFDKGNWKEEWSQRSVLPHGLAVELDLEDYGTIRRQFLIGAGGQRAEENSQSSNPDQGGNDSNNGNNGGNNNTNGGNGDSQNGGGANAG